MPQARLVARDVRFGPEAGMRSVGAQDRKRIGDDQNGFQVACGVNLR